LVANCLYTDAGAEKEEVYWKGAWGGDWSQYGKIQPVRTQKPGKVPTESRGKLVRRTEEKRSCKRTTTQTATGILGTAGLSEK